MTSLFLKAKHWQIFLLVFAIPFALQIVIMFMLIQTSFESEAVDRESFFDSFSLMAVVFVLYIGGIFGWFWSAGVGLQEKIPQKFQLRTTTFKFFLLFPLIYMAFFIMLFVSPDEWMFGDSGFIAQFFPAGIIGHLFSMFCIFYVMWFIAKTIKTAEEQRPVKFADFVGEFFLIWFFIIGIWILQPKINRLHSSQELPDDPGEDGILDSGNYLK